jgi:hypothetical protein
LEDTVFFQEELKIIEEKYLLDAGRFGFIIETQKIKEFKESLSELKTEFIGFLKTSLKTSKKTGYVIMT